MDCRNRDENNNALHNIIDVLFYDIQCMMNTQIYIAQFKP